MFKAVLKDDGVTLNVYDIREKQERREYGGLVGMVEVLSFLVFYNGEFKYMPSSDFKEVSENTTTTIHLNDAYDFLFDEAEECPEFKDEIGGGVIIDNS